MKAEASGHFRFVGIDGLRAFAVTSVLIYHLNRNYLPGGFVGVDIFFVISGYVVCRALMKERGQPSVSAVGTFYVRRIFRIYPALLVVLFAGGLLLSLFVPHSDLSALNGRTGAWAYFGVSNIALAAFKNPYFSENNDFNLFTHTWSLGVEQQYYLLFPLLLFALFKGDRGQVGFRKIARFALPALALGSWLYSAQETVKAHDSAYFNMPGRFWELAVGALLCLAHEKKRFLPNSNSQSRLVMVLGVALLLVAVFTVTPEFFPFPLAIVPVGGSCLCICSLVANRPAGPVATFLMHPATVWIGRVSYSLYLWHWVIIVFFRWTVGLESYANQLLVVLLSLATSTASYYWIEKPFQRVPEVFVRRRMIMLAGCICAIGVSYVAFRIMVSTSVRNAISLSVVTRNRTDWYPDIAEGQTAGVVGKRWANRRLFAVGDSHAWAYGGMLQELQRADGVAVYVNSDPGSRVASLVYPENEPAVMQARAVIERLSRLSRPGDIVFISSLRLRKLCETSGATDSEYTKSLAALETEPNRIAAVRQGVEFIRKLQQLGLTVVIEAPLPVFRSPPFRCSDWFNRMNPVGRAGFSIERAFILDHRASAMKSIAEVQEQLVDVHVWDPLAILCPGENCWAFEGEKPLFFDGDHLSAYGGVKLYPSFASMLQSLWGN